MKNKERPEPKVAVWPIKDLKQSAYNPRRINKARFEDLKRSIKADPEFAKVREIIVNVNPKRRGIIIGGHMRFLAMQELGHKEVTVKEVFATLKQEKAMNLKDNSHHGSFDRAAVAEMVLENPIDFEHALPTDELDEILDEYGPAEQMDASTEEEQIDEIAKGKAITKFGDKWELGNHILVCGDSTDPATFDKLLNKEKAAMVWTDPPYNVDYEGKTKKKLKINNDKMSPSKFAVFVRAFMKNIRENVSGSTYICMSTKEWPLLHSAFLEAGFHWSDTIIWMKDRFALGRSDMHKQHEPIMVGKPRRVTKSEGDTILYGWPKGVNRKWNGGRDQSNTWFFKRPHTNPIHPTQKPVELVAQAITNSSNRGDIVMDCFGGGGSTLIACERTGRQARLIELDVGYCDAMIARYVGHTKDAALHRNGKPHEWKGPVITIEGVLDSLG